MTQTPYAFFRGSYMPVSEAKVSIMTHALHYGTAVFEGVRGNWNADKKTTYIFRLQEHLERLVRGSRMLMLNFPYSLEDLMHITVETVERAGYREDVYIRPIAYKSEEKVANLKLHELSSDFNVIVVPFGRYVESEALRCCTSSWRRVEDTMMPPRLKIAGIYVNSILAKTEAVLAGYDEAILLTQSGYVSEGTGENLFMVNNGMLHTPSMEDNPLEGITRACVMTLARDEMGIEVVERHIGRSELYLADEVFLTGTAAHLTPVVELDHRKIGEGKPGPVTKKLQSLYFDIVRGNNPKYMRWCTPATPRPVKA